MVSQGIKSITSEIAGNSETFYASYYETGPAAVGTWRYRIPAEFAPVADLLFAELRDRTTQRAVALADALAACLAPKYHRGELDYVVEEDWSDLSTADREVETRKYDPRATVEAWFSCRAGNANRRGSFGSDAMPQKPHPFAAKIRELRQSHDASLRKILDTADEIEAKTGVRPDVRRLYRERGTLPLPEWFK
jgi:hypothetical protein